MTITIELTDEQARAVIRATSVYGRELDQIRHDIEHKADTQDKDDGQSNRG